MSENLELDNLAEVSLLVPIYDQAWEYFDGMDIKNRKKVRDLLLEIGYRIEALRVGHKVESIMLLIHKYHDLLLPMRHCFDDMLSEIQSEIKDNDQDVLYDTAFVKNHERILVEDYFQLARSYNMTTAELSVLNDKYPDIHSMVSLPKRGFWAGIFSKKPTIDPEITKAQDRMAQLHTEISILDTKLREIEQNQKKYDLMQANKDLVLGKQIVQAKIAYLHKFIEISDTAKLD